MFCQNTISHNRISKDKTYDTKGKKLIELIDNVGGLILNGRQSEDRPGNYTFCGSVGSSVIDYGICSYDFLKFVDEFNVGTKPFSDHMPLTLKLLSTVDKNLKACSMPPKLKWNDNKHDKYCESLESFSIINNLLSTENIETKLQLILNKIYYGADKIKNIKFFDSHNRWFDSRCEAARRDMLQKLDWFRKYNLITFKNLYDISKHFYKTLCSEKKQNLLSQDIDKLNHVRSSKEWWKLAHSIKNVQPKISNNLSVVTFYDHFKNLFLNSCFSNSISWTLPFVVDPIFDNPFEMSELVFVLHNLKLNKSPGIDRIPYEFYKYAPENFVNELLVFLNTVYLKHEFPESFNRSITLPLYKKGDINLVTNYRGLSLQDTIYKIFTGLVLNRITH